MFLGHIAVGFASKRLAPRTSLGVLIAAPMLVDLLWPLFLLAGLENVAVSPGDTAFTPLRFVSYPITHSLVGGFLWASLFAGLHYGLWSRRYEALVVFGSVVSHWVLDVISHRPDMPVLPEGPYLGLGLWNWPAATVAVELGLFIAAATLYQRMTTAKDETGRFGLNAYFLLLCAVYAGAIFGPVAPSANAVAYSALALWILPPLAGWIDSHRKLLLAARRAAA